jgi:antitoxin component of RelBE/YafQ-DinJ toxin-antitoxin module
MANARKKRSGRISLYVPPELHAELAAIGETLGLDINGLVRLMIARTIGHYRVEAELLMTQAQENLNLLNRWRSENPGRPIREFWEDYWRYWRAKEMKQAFEAIPGTIFETAEDMAARVLEANNRETRGGKNQ